MMRPSTAPRWTALASISILIALVLGGCGGKSGESSDSNPYYIAPDARSCEELSSNLPLSSGELKQLARRAIERAEKSGARGANVDAVAADIKRAIASLCAQRGQDYLAVPEGVSQVAGSLTRASAPPPATGSTEPPVDSPPATEAPPPTEAPPADEAPPTPPAYEPPTHEPPAEEPPTHEPPAEPPHTGVG